MTSQRADAGDMPRFLFRGDTDPQGKRNLRTVWPGSSYGGLLTNLSNGGSGLEIFLQPLIDSVNKHVAEGWAKTHFLSFSSSRSIAMMYAAVEQKRPLLKVGVSEYWDAALTTLDTNNFVSRREVEQGMFVCRYSGRKLIGNHSLPIVQKIARAVANRKNGSQLVEILLVDVARFLDKYTQPDISEAINNSHRDQEWLVLPLEPSEGVLGQLTSKLDDGCIADFECFRLLA
jgi:hypothetical protein